MVNIEITYNLTIIYLIIALIIILQFYEIVDAYLKLPFEHQLFGIPIDDKISNYVVLFELHYLVEIMQHGALFFVLIIILNIYLYFRLFFKKIDNKLIHINLIISILYGTYRSYITVPQELVCTALGLPYRILFLLYFHSNTNIKNYFYK